MPPITGLVLSSVKENELVEVPLTSPLPTGQTNPLLAHWTYGLGRSVAFTSDAGRRWAKTWPDWESYAAFWSQVVRWSMRPVDRGNLTLSVRRDEGRIKVVVDALDKDNQFLNFLQIQGNVVDPDLKRSTVELSQTAPGKYEATIEDAEASGNYFVNLGYRGPDGVQGVISSGVSVPYSDEYRELRSNPATLETLASLTDGEVVTWKCRPDGRSTRNERWTRSTTSAATRSWSTPRVYRRSGRACSGWRRCLFLGDVAVRRIAPDVDRMQPGGRRSVEEAPRPGGRARREYMEKLKSRKAEVGEQLDRSLRRHPVRGSAARPRLRRLDEPLLEGRGGRRRDPRRPGEARAGQASPPSGRRPSPRATPTASSRPSRRSGRSGRRRKERIIPDAMARENRALTPFAAPGAYHPITRVLPRRVRCADRSAERKPRSALRTLRIFATTEREPLQGVSHAPSNH